ncbi:MAG TPA: tRNA (N6-isopentenyl adenosine(37)-C2)-methylthiotransferase MiaB [Pyrinomonadaceae bacterium]|nr:tRNA (N6-isopentenyl adenosine(37)-C2)-methylthiotransferase MiaB [Pyrinomonadaceae bacterium]
MKKVYLETFGCQMNVSDSERVATSLASKGYEITSDEENADVVLINTCSVREKAEQKLYTRVGRLRSSGRKPMVGIMGCVAQLEGETLFKKIQGVDLVLGTRAVGRAAGAIEAVLENGPGFSDLGEREADYDWSVAERQQHSPYVAFVPIIEGCNKFCTYCIVPFSRGRETSLPASDIVRQILELRRRGVKEIHLIGQNVNSYRPVTESGLEGFAGATPFSRLLRAVAATGIERVKFNTSFPRDFHPDIVDAIDEHENLCNWVHLPVQSGSDRVLKDMRRLHTIDSYYKKIDKMRASARDISISTDIIVGFPGETEEDFRETVKLVEYCGYDSAYIFKYSPRPGTPAYEMIDDVSEEEKTRRFRALEQVQRIHQFNNLQRYLNKSLKVLAERPSAKSPENLTGHSTCHRVVNFKGSSDKLGTIVDVRITEVKSNSLFGEVV